MKRPERFTGSLRWQKQCFDIPALGTGMTASGSSKVRNSAPACAAWPRCTGIGSVSGLISSQHHRQIRLSSWCSNRQRLGAKVTSSELVWFSTSSQVRCRTLEGPLLLHASKSRLVVMMQFRRVQVG